MLDAEAWYTAPDDTIESLGFLVVKTEGADDGASRIPGWELGVGNTTQLVRVESATAADTGGEAALLRTLLNDQLDAYRRAEPPLTIVTASQSTLPRLRDRVLATDIDATLRGLRHLSLGALLAEYFDAGCPPALPTESSTDADADSDDADVEQLRLAMNRIVPLVPRGAASVPL